MEVDYSEFQPNTGFDVTQITLFRKYEHEMTKKCIRALAKLIEII